MFKYIEPSDLSEQQIKELQEIQAAWEEMASHGGDYWHPGHGRPDMVADFTGEIFDDAQTGRCWYRIQYHPVERFAGKEWYTLNTDEWDEGGWGFVSTEGHPY